MEVEAEVVGQVRAFIRTWPGQCGGHLVDVEFGQIRPEGNGLAVRRPRRVGVAPIVAVVDATDLRSSATGSADHPYSAVLELRAARLAVPVDGIRDLLAVGAPGRAVLAASRSAGRDVGLRGP